MEEHQVRPEVHGYTKTTRTSRILGVPPERAFLKLCKDSKFKKRASKYQVVPWEQCAFNLKNPSSKTKYRKASVLITTDKDLAKIFSERRCACPRGSHEVLQGNTKVKGKSCRRTQIAETYPKEMARCVARHVMQNCRHVFPTSPLGTSEWKVWNDVPFELRKQIERVHRNFGHASVQQFERLFKDGKVGQEALRALKLFKCDACESLKQPPSRRRIAMAHAENFNDLVSIGVNWWNLICENADGGKAEKNIRVLNVIDEASQMHMAVMITNHSVQGVWEAFSAAWLRWAGAPEQLRVDPHRAQIAKEFFNKCEAKNIKVDPATAEAHWWLGIAEAHAQYLRQMRNKVVKDMTIKGADFQELLDELGDAKTRSSNMKGSCQSSGSLVTC